MNISLVPRLFLQLVFHVFVILQLARIIKQERSRAEAVVELVLSKEVLSVHFDDICEYVGDVEDMDM